MALRNSSLLRQSSLGCGGWNDETPGYGTLRRDEHNLRMSLFF
jgi:hypothetical protein